MKYAIQFTDDGLADAKALPKNTRNSLRKELRETLARDPYGCSSQLHEPLEGWRSFRYRNYRVVFRVYEDLRVIAIGGIGQRLPQSRSDIYKKLEALALEGKLAERVLQILREFSSGTA